MSGSLRSLARRAFAAAAVRPTVAAAPKAPYANIALRAMATGPKLLLLDEIAGGLTEGECQSLVGTIRDIHAEGVTIIWIEHVLHALNAVVERLLVLDFGRVIGIGDPKEIMESREVREIYLGIEV